jgi:hypothetical protein
MRTFLVFLAIWGALAPSAGRAQRNAAYPPDDAQIVITINPEARVSAVLGAPLPSPGACGTTTDLNVHVINQGFVTAAFRATVAGGDSGDVAISLDGPKLTGNHDEVRRLHITVFRSEVRDVAIAFSVQGNFGEATSDGSVHFIFRCFQGSEGSSRD